MSGRVVVRHVDGERQVRPVTSSRPSRRFAAVEVDGACAVVDASTGELVAYASDRRVFDIARLLNVLDPSPEQLAALLGDARLLRTLILEYDGSVCWRCGRRLKRGSFARWNTATRLVRHLRSCPKAAGAKRGRSA